MLTPKEHNVMIWFNGFCTLGMIVGLAASAHALWYHSIQAGAIAFVTCVAILFFILSMKDSISQ